MRILGFTWFIALAALLAAQSTVHFGNTATTLITTNDLQGATGPISPTGGYQFGLYLGSGGSSAEALTLATMTGNLIAPGRFEGGTSPLPAGFPVGSVVTYQVRGWSGLIGAPDYYGVSTIGSFMVPAIGTIELFGNGPGQVGGFELRPVPEPAMWMLAMLSIMAFAFVRRRKHQRLVLGAHSTLLASTHL